jgi:hypothetical protein
MRFLLIFISLFLYAKEYSIWVCSSTKLDEIEKNYLKFKTYPNARIAKIGNYYVLKIGKANRIKSLRKLLKTVRIEYKSAFIKNIKWNMEKVIKYNEKLENITNEKVFNIFGVVYKEENETKKINISDKKFSKEVNVSTKVELPLYAKFSLELTKYNKSNIVKLLKQHDKLPVMDRVQGEINVGNIAKAYKDVYFNMKHNYSDYLSYKQARDLYMQYSNRLNILTKFNNIDKINSIENNTNLKIYIFNPYYLYISNDSIISKNNNSTYKNIQTLDIETNIGLETLTNRGSIYAQIGYRKSYETFLEYLLKYNTIITKYISYEGKLGFNQKSDGENTYLLYAGKKDYFSNNFTFNLTNKDSIYLNVDYSKFYSQDSVYLGDSIMEYIKYMHKLRVTYPDFSYYTYFKNSNYKQTDKKGDIKNISTIENFDTLSKSYYETGVGFLFGWRHYDTYTKIWRPFLDSSIFYNNLTNVGVNISLGIGGSIYHQDNLSFGINYSTPQNNINNYFEVLINYNLWF